MTVYARSDVMHVGISRDLGGCGEGHGRPVVAGAPAKVWALTCHGGCEDYLRSDPLWSGTPQGVPETPDETAIREDVERRGQLEQQQSTAAALEQLAKLGDLPSAIAQLAQIMSGQQPQLAPAMDVLCRSGHRNRSDARFCAQCGASMDEPVAANRGPALPPAEKEAAPVQDTSPAAAEVPADLEALSLPELKEIAARLGVKTARSKADQVAAIRAVA